MCPSMEQNATLEDLVNGSVSPLIVNVKDVITWYSTKTLN